MIKYENDCCGCTVPAYPCLGHSCPLKHSRHLYCGKCHDDVDKLYIVGEEELQKRMYKYPYDNYKAELDIDDIGYSDKTMCIGVEIIDE